MSEFALLPDAIVLHPESCERYSSDLSCQETTGLVGAGPDTALTGRAG
jgi:hypothetical protein